MTAQPARLGRRGPETAPAADAPPFKPSLVKAVFGANIGQRALTAARADA
ncbi:hypothetical protein RKD29_003324 [Streptomyces tendae]